jgi:hypothetical protein
MAIARAKKQGHASQSPTPGRRVVSQTMILPRHPATDRSQPPRAGGLLCMSFRPIGRYSTRRCAPSGFAPPLRAPSQPRLPRHTKRAPWVASAPFPSGQRHRRADKPAAYSDLPSLLTRVLTFFGHTQQLIFARDCSETMDVVRCAS